MRILIRTSRWAIWARWLGGLALPLLVIPILLHRERLIVGDVFLATMAAAAVVALLAVLMGLFALGRLWQSGDQGWTKALIGLFLGLLCLVPFGYYGRLALQYPAVTDIATADRALMPLVFEPGTADMPAPKMLNAVELAAEFPNVETRSYPLGQSQTFELVKSMVEERGWAVRLLRAPDGVGGAGQINAQAVTIPGWREEVVLRVTGTPDNASVDMRSASLNARHDLGSNGLRVEEFLVALDDAVTRLLRDNPNANQPVELGPTTAPEVQTSPLSEG